MPDRKRALTLCPSCGALAGDLHAEDCGTLWASRDMHTNTADVSEQLSSETATNSTEHFAGRIGTIHIDPDTGEYVMPGDFPGEPELRWKAAAQDSGPGDRVQPGAPSDRADSPDVPPCGAGGEASAASMANPSAPALQDADLQTKPDFANDQCPECRAPPGSPHHPDCRFRMWRGIRATCGNCAHKACAELAGELDYPACVNWRPCSSSSPH